MKFRSILSLVVLLLLLTPLAFPQSRETGAILGKVTDDQNNPLPGVTMTLTSPKIMGVRTQVTDANGFYRFPALPPGVYAVKADLPGFRSILHEDILITTTVTLTVDFALVPTTVEEQVTVIAQSPTVDIKSTETASVTLSNETLRNIPYSQFTRDIVNMAPAVTSQVAYGAPTGRGISWQMDGVGVGDPDYGTSWVFLNSNIIEEAKVMGVGLPAEYGAFTGVIFNLVTKQGGNTFSGQVELDYQGYNAPRLSGDETQTFKSDFPGNGFWGTSNNAHYVADWPDVTSPQERMMDGNVQLGGPILKDKLWFYGGLQWFETWNWVTGFPLAQDYKQPRAFLKLTSQVTAKTNLNFSFEYDNYNGTYRGARATVLPEATVNQEDPNYILNFSLTQILSPKTFIDIKAAGFTGYYNLNPRTGRDINGHFFDDDAPDTVPGGGEDSGNKRHYSYGAFSEHDRTRGQINASLTHYADDFIKGSHDFKFGVEVEHAYVRNKYGYTGTGAWYYEDYWGPSYYSYYYNNPAYDYTGPYIRTQYVGYETKTRYTRLEVFAQDSWQITDRLNINLGLRFSQNWGTIDGRDGVPYSAARLAPRVGFTFDVLGDKTTILKAHFGQFTDAMYASILDRLSPNFFSDRVVEYWDPVYNEWYEASRTVHGDWTMDPNIKHPYMQQFTAGIERELFRDASFSITYINRSYHNFIGFYNANAVWAPKTVHSAIPVNGIDTFTVYDRVAGGDDPAYVITNLENMTDVFADSLGTINPYRDYWGLEFLFQKRFSSRWALMLSYVYSRTKGTVDNNNAALELGWGGSEKLDDPNHWINTDGYATYDNIHQIKAQATYVLPFGINFSAYFHGATNGSWATRLRTKKFTQGRITFYAEPRGSHHYDIDKTLDLRLEKTFTIAGKYQLGVMFDVFNVFNDNTITDWGTRLDYDYYPAALDPTYGLSTDGHDLYGLVYPRRARVGLRLIF